jgi:hypothetical protein
MDEPTRLVTASVTVTPIRVPGSIVAPRLRGPRGSGRRRGGALAKALVPGQELSLGLRRSEQVRELTDGHHGIARSLPVAAKAFAAVVEVKALTGPRGSYSRAALDGIAAMAGRASLATYSGPRSIPA